MTQNDALQRTPHPARGGGSNAPLMSRGSEEEGGKRISSEGLPPLGRKGNSTFPGREEEEQPAPNRKRGEGASHSEGGEESPHPQDKGRM